MGNIRTKDELKQEANIELVMALRGIGNGYDIEAQEARGQQQVTSQVDRLPTDGLSKCGCMGIKICAPVDGDPIFTNVELPTGWKIEPTDHSMWSKLMDDKGRKRAGVFYKAAFYDRKAHVQAHCRFNCEAVYPESRNDIRDTAIVTDQCSKDPIYTAKSQPVDGDDRWAPGDRSMKDAKQWLKENYPDHENPGAYWDK